MLLLLVTLTIMGCKEGVSKEEVKESEAKADIEKTTSEEADVVPFLDYPAFEKEYLQRSNDTTYVVNFWATWCKPCVKELSAFEQIGSAYKDQKVKVILVSLDCPDKVASHVIPFIEKRNLRSEVILLDDPDHNGWIPKVSEEWSGAIPATVMVRDGAKQFYERSFTYEELEVELQSML